MTSNSLISFRQSMSCRACIACVWIVFCVMGVSFGAASCGSLDRTVNAIRMAKVLYPELKGKELSLQFSGGRGGPLSSPTEARYLVISVDKTTSASPGQTENLGSTFADASDLGLPLHLGFDFVRTIFDKAGNRVGTELSCQPVDFMNEVGSKQIHDAWTVINAHPEWTDEQDLDAARKLGMRFGPEHKADLFRTLPLKELSSIYGPLQIASARFTVTGLKEPETSFALLHWLITAKIISNPQKPPMQIMVEPFQGKVINISQ